MLFIQQRFSGKDKDLLPGKTSFPLCNSRAVCSGLLKHRRLSTPDLVWGSQMPEPMLQSPGQHWHLTALPRVQPGVSWRALYQQQTQWNTSSLIFKCWAEWGEWWATYSSLLVSQQGLTEMPQKKWSSCPTCLFFNLNLPVTLARLV